MHPDSPPEQELLQLESRLLSSELLRIIELCWSFTIFSSQSEGTRYISDLGTHIKLSEDEKAMANDPQVWANIVEVIESKLEGGISLKTLDMLNQIRCHV